MHLASPNWLGIGAVKMCVQPWAVSTQMMPHLVSKGRHCAGTKGLLNTLLEERDSLKGLGPLCLERARQAVVSLTGHSLQSGVAGIHLSISEDL